MKEWIDKMLNDNSLSNKDKIELLESWKNSVNEKISSNILHSSELLELNEIISYMDENINNLNK